MGCISAGTHELNITSGNGGEWNCVNLDCFKLIDDWKNEWTGKNSESGAIITTSELQDAIHHWLDDIPVRGHNVHSGSSGNNSDMVITLILNIF